jgi:predicted DNA-binding transcriptional regulator AlpA
MTSATRSKHSITPRLLRREAAASYMAVSTGTFDRLVREGKLPAPKLLDSIKCWDRYDLDARADDLAYDGAAVPDDGPSDLDRLLGT